MGRPLAHDHAGPPEGHWAESGGLGGFVRKTRADLDRDPPSLGPRLAHQLEKQRVDDEGIRGAQTLNQPGAGPADLQQAPRHALVEKAGEGGIWGGG